jgi:hypothetical protein
MWITFRPDENGKMAAYDSQNKHDCNEYKELKRVGSDANMLQTAKNLIALVNSRLRGYRIDITVRELRRDN